jgi:NADPH2:quinone reductase
MKAIQYYRFGGPDVLEYVDVPVPIPGDGEVAIKTTAIGVNFPDIRERLGVYNREETRVGGVTLPHIGGLQVVGRVTAVGPGVAAALYGAKVMALMKKGAYAQSAVADARMLVVLPSGADDVAMASLPTQGVTAYLTLKASAGLQPGESVLVHGAAGGVGSLAVQIARALGAGTVIGTASSTDRRDFVMSLGADFAVPYDAPDWPEAVRAHTGGRGVDVLLESIGGDVFEQNFQCLATFGRHVVLGSTRGPGEPFAPRRLMTRAQALVGFYLPVFFQRPELIQEALRFLTDGVLGGKIKPAVATILPLSEAAEAHRRLESREARGVIVLTPDE